MNDDLRPFAGVTIETHVVGRIRIVTSVGEATEVLLHDWPETGRGEAYRGALHACYEALEGELDVEDARDAFIAAAQEAGIFVRAAARIG
jgi:hypothetical protein